MSKEKGVVTGRTMGDAFYSLFSWFWFYVTVIAVFFFISIIFRGWP